MGKTTLGLPLEYSKLHLYYDVLSAGDSEVKNSLIEKLLKKHKIETVLDMTCGTGSQVLFLAKHGYNVTGLDISPDLLKLARNKAEKEKNVEGLFEGDMRSSHVGLFDAVITIFNAIGHLEAQDFEKALQNIRRNLKEDGLYVFDIFNLDAMTDEVVHDLSMDMTKVIENTNIHHVQTSKIDRKSGLLTSTDCFTIQEGPGNPKILKGEFSLQLYTPKELREMLTRNGFETLDQLGLDGSPLNEQKTQNILTVAKKGGV